jgi:hypothetical protein
LPIEQFALKQIHSGDGDVKISQPVDYPATAIVLEDKDPRALARGAFDIVNQIKAPYSLNALFLRTGDMSRIYLFPRGKEESKYYGGKPASIEMCGMLVFSKFYDKRLYDNPDPDLVEKVISDVSAPVSKLGLRFFNA